MFSPSAALPPVQPRIAAHLARADRYISRTEQRIADGLTRRDPAALEALHEAHGATVIGFLTRTLGERAAAEDVFQQVFLEAWQRGASYDPRRAGPLSWLLAIARSRAIDHLRRRIPEPRDPTGALALREAGPEDPDGIDALVEQWRVADLLGRLPADEADMLRRRFYGGQSQREIAAATGTPLGTVKMRMARALERLRVLIAAEEGER
jgi:RNA polymerase sigma-70 factor, ECF subfamily